MNTPIDTRSALERRQDEIESAQERAEHEAWHDAWRDKREAWGRDNWPPTDEERGIDWSRDDG